jgi:hypothetical protein
MRHVPIRTYREEDLMSASTASPAPPTNSRRIDSPAGGTRRDITARFESIRSTAGDVGDRMPGLVDGVRTGAASGAREIDGWPEETRSSASARVWTARTMNIPWLRVSLMRSTTSGRS